MSWTTFTNDSGALTEIIDADEVNANFDYLEGTIAPMSSGTYADDTYNIGTSSAHWLNGYITNLPSVSSARITNLTATTVDINTLKVSQVLGLGAFNEVTFGDANYDRLEIKEDDNTRVSFSKNGDPDAFNILQNAYYDGSWHSYDPTRHSWRQFMVGGTGIGNYIHWMIADPATVPSFTEVMKLSEGGTLTTQHLKNSGAAQFLGTTSITNLDVANANVTGTLSVTTLDVTNANVTSLTASEFSGQFSQNIDPSNNQNCNLLSIIPTVDIANVHGFVAHPNPGAGITITNFYAFRAYDNAGAGDVANHYLFKIGPDYITNSVVKVEIDGVGARSMPVIDSSDTMTVQNLKVSGNSTFGNTNYDRLEIADDGISRAVISKSGADESLDIFFNTVNSAGTLYSYDNSRHSWLQSFIATTTSRNFITWQVAQPATLPSFTEVMKLSEGGTLTTQHQVISGTVNYLGASRFRAYPASIQAFTASAISNVKLGNESYDNLGEFTITGDYFKADNAGYYMFYAQVSVNCTTIATGASQHAGISLSKNGLTISSSFFQGDNSEIMDDHTIAITDCVNLAANDQVSVQFVQTFATVGSILIQEAKTYFLGHRLS